jgi:hypothetical protein
MKTRTSFSWRRASVIFFLLSIFAQSGIQAATFDFRASDQGWVPGVESGSANNPFLWSPTAGLNGGAWFTNGDEDASIKTLTSPALVALGTGPVTIWLDHRYNFQYDEPFDARDGAHLRYRVNGGAWTSVLGTEITDMYEPDQDGIDGLGPDFEAGWSRASDNYSVPAYITSGATPDNLLLLQPGDLVQVQLRAGWDNDIAVSAPNWEIAAVEITNVAVPEPGEWGLLTAVFLFCFVLRRVFLRRANSPSSGVT